jgi:hypothetical protein
MENGGDLFTIAYSALFHASGNMKGESRIVEYLLKSNIIPITKGILNDSLYNASLHSSHPIMELLLDNGAEPEVRVGTNAVKLHDAVALQMLVKRGLDIDKPNPDNNPNFSCRKMAEYYKINIDELLTALLTKSAFNKSAQNLTL